MRKALKTLGLALLLISVTHAGSVAAPNGEIRCLNYGDPFLFDFAVDSYTKNTGALTLRVTITYCPETRHKPTCDLLTLSVYPVRGLTYTGEDTLLLPYGDKSPITLSFDVLVPREDTSALIFLWECGGTARFLGPAFVPSGDSVETFWAYPYFYSDLMEERTMRHLEPYLQKDYERAKREWEAQQESLKHVGKSITGHLPRPTPEDSARWQSRQKGITLDSLHKLEQTPETTYTTRFLYIGDTLYVRRMGEYKFRPAETYASREEAEQAMRNRKPDPSKEQHIVIDLRKQEDYEFVEKLVDSLIPMEKTGYYHTVTTYGVIDKIKAHRIEYSIYPRYPGEKPPPGLSKRSRASASAVPLRLEQQVSFQVQRSEMKDRT
ncbi:MAG: hypothetical protein ACE5K8_05230 [Candidatus Zixiibacteriota bacterium]